jgi:hypothetical protein
LGGKEEDRNPRIIQNWMADIDKAVKLLDLDDDNAIAYAYMKMGKPAQHSHFFINLKLCNNKKFFITPLSGTFTEFLRLITPPYLIIKKFFITLYMELEILYFSSTPEFSTRILEERIKKMLTGSEHTRETFSSSIRCDEKYSISSSM